MVHMFNPDGTISPLNERLLKFVDHFTNLNSNISTEIDIDICIGKPLTTFDHMKI